MMKTEDEARQCWCPAARVGRGEGCNRYSFDTDLFDGHAFARCIASDCMWWRWDRAASNAEFNKMAQDGISRAPVGYCGLAGHPDPDRFIPRSDAI